MNPPRESAASDAISSSSSRNSLNNSRTTVLRQRKMQQQHQPHDQKPRKRLTPNAPSLLAFRPIRFLSIFVLVAAIAAGIVQTQQHWVPLVNRLLSPNNHVKSIDQSDRIAAAVIEPYQNSDQKIEKDTGKTEPKMTAKEIPQPTVNQPPLSPKIVEKDSGKAESKATIKEIPQPTVNQPPINPKIVEKDSIKAEPKVAAKEIPQPTVNQPPINPKIVENDSGKAEPKVAAKEIPQPMVNQPPLSPKIVEFDSGKAESKATIKEIPQPMVNQPPISPKIVEKDSVKAEPKVAAKEIPQPTVNQPPISPKIVEKESGKAEPKVAAKEIPQPTVNQPPISPKIVEFHSGKAESKATIKEIPQPTANQPPISPKIVEKDSGKAEPKVAAKEIPQPMVNQPTLSPKIVEKDSVNSESKATIKEIPQPPANQPPINPKIVEKDSGKAEPKVAAKEIPQPTVNQPPISPKIVEKDSVKAESKATIKEIPQPMINQPPLSPKIVERDSGKAEPKVAAKEIPQPTVNQPPINPKIVEKDSVKAEPKVAAKEISQPTANQPPLSPKIVENDSGKAESKATLKESPQKMETHPSPSSTIIEKDAREAVPKAAAKEIPQTKENQFVSSSEANKENFKKAESSNNDLNPNELKLKDEKRNSELKTEEKPISVRGWLDSSLSTPEFDIDAVSSWVHSEIGRGGKQEIIEELRKLLIEEKSDNYVRVLAINATLNDIDSTEDDDNPEKAKIALEAYTRTLELLDPNRLKLRSNILHRSLDICLRQALYKEALGYANSLLQLNPNNPEVLTELGTLLTYEGESEKAMEIFKKIIAMKEANEDDRNFAYLNLGMLTLHTHRDFKTASDYFLKGLDSNPVEARFYAYATESLIRVRKLDKAIEINKRAYEEGILLSPYQLSASTILGLRNNRFWSLDDCAHRKDFEQLDSIMAATFDKTDFWSKLEPFFSEEDPYLMEYGNAKIVPLLNDGELSDNCRENVDSRLNALCKALENFGPSKNCRVCDAFLLELSGKSKYWPRSGVSNFRLRAIKPLVNGMGVEMIDQKENHVAFSDKNWILIDDSFLHRKLNTNETNAVALVVDMWHPDVTEEDKKSIAQM